MARPRRRQARTIRASRSHRSLRSLAWRARRHASDRGRSMATSGAAICGALSWEVPLGGRALLGSIGGSLDLPAARLDVVDGLVGDPAGLVDQPLRDPLRLLP